MPAGLLPSATALLGILPPCTLGGQESLVPRLVTNVQVRNWKVMWSFTEFLWISDSCVALPGGPTVRCWDGSRLEGTVVTSETEGLTCSCGSSSPCLPGV